MKKPEYLRIIWSMWLGEGLRAQGEGLRAGLFLLCALSSALCASIGAQNKTRTCTPLPAPAPQAGVSTNFTIWADKGVKGVKALKR